MTNYHYAILWASLHYKLNKLTSLSEESPAELGAGGGCVGGGDTEDVSDRGPDFPKGADCVCPCGTLINGPAGW